MLLGISIYLLSDIWLYFVDQFRGEVIDDPLETIRKTRGVYGAQCVSIVSTCLSVHYLKSVYTDQRVMWL